MIFLSNKHSGGNTATRGHIEPTTSLKFPLAFHHFHLTAGWNNKPEYLSARLSATIPGPQCTPVKRFPAATTGAPTTVLGDTPSGTTNVFILGFWLCSLGQLAIHGILLWYLGTSPHSERAQSGHGTYRSALAT